jgi:hypothetical protein
MHATTQSQNRKTCHTRIDLDVTWFDPIQIPAPSVTQTIRRWFPSNILRLVRACELQAGGIEPNYVLVEPRQTWR